MARAFYALIRSASNHDPIVATPQVQGSTSKQVKAHRFCSDCENRLNKRGEEWVLRSCWRADDEFQLREALERCGALAKTSDGMSYATASSPDIDADKLDFFAISVFWRAALESWPAVFGHVPTRLELGEYEESLRLFLVDLAPFPRHAVLTVFVTYSTDPMPHRVAMSFPYYFGRYDGGMHYRFTVLGLTFDLALGRTIESLTRQRCHVRAPHRPIYRLAAMDEKNVDGALRLLAKGKPTRRLKKEIGDS
jgi:hypothetical protein